ncbi:hypothetical protein FJV41_23465 [Myxococcus llanfairpwllgwyngyllgogerychwyrndrobwllllantysiliogogogochensis]|uniref:Uncharacterized protein n=1 Tax=Myxococcus llanfairpwllgwyngyllgogerychwyrndrobwllllantysiliogogogochensis TaxID=2590453 RepID=A0A540WX00_9BACT|nr:MULTISPECIES: hypothetical protein [Myxococcus]NTX16449.1 hypothetical protein [Myxococcus sp. CA056]NTX50404.1 hypothetical protein [Myxococcus sp. CA039A]TQF13535.1 hypothetical protein FJV41_23465 [Myxococcus llanfairpwllgwyngyllgogerychwyrndrobwllllantysiliogogogochensis]
MGLAERRRIATIKESHTPRFQSELNSSIGFSMPFEIDIASFPEDKTILDCYDSYYESYGPGLVAQAMKSICSDDLGREAVKSKFNKIIFQNVATSPDNPGDKNVELKDNTLFVRESFYGYSDKLFGEDELRTIIESLL